MRCHADRCRTILDTAAEENVRLCAYHGLIKVTQERDEARTEVQRLTQEVTDWENEGERLKQKLEAIASEREARKDKDPWWCY